MFIRNRLLLKDNFTKNAAIFKLWNKKSNNGIFGKTNFLRKS